ncbi:MAG: hypothetical protein JNK72_03975 [Myxococcales bacterium]|nr:hypothetical protein [Myxococcales bacterium]
MKFHFHCRQNLAFLALLVGGSQLPPARLARADAPTARRPIAPTPEPLPQAPRCLGRWQGEGQNAGPVWSIDMTVTAEEGATCGVIEYPSLGCGGLLTRCHREGDRVYFTEVYTHNPGTCAPAGRIEARCEGVDMFWRWRGEDRVDTVLHRVESQPRGH